MELILQNITKSFDEKVILHDASFTFETGKIYGLLGRNGAGKTTLFHCISQNMDIDSGTIALDKGTGANEKYDSTDIGYVYTVPHLPTFMTGYEFVKYFMEINKERISQPKSPEEYLQLVGIEEKDQHVLLRDYSHGMQNKVQMLVSLIVKPPVLLLDEPLTSFDVVAAHEMKELLLGLKSDSIIIFSTHILQLAQDLCDEIVLLHHRTLRGIHTQEVHAPNFEEEIIELLSETDEGGAQ